MSYVAPKTTGDLVNDWMKRLADFMNVRHHLLEASTPQAFEVWFEKLELIDKRSLYFYIKENKENIPREYLDMVEYRFPRPF